MTARAEKLTGGEARGAGMLVGKEGQRVAVVAAANRAKRQRAWRHRPELAEPELAELEPKEHFIV